MKNKKDKFITLKTSKLKNSYWLHITEENKWIHIKSNKPKKVVKIDPLWSNFITGHKTIIK